MMKLSPPFKPSIRPILIGLQTAPLREMGNIKEENTSGVTSPSKRDTERLEPEASTANTVGKRKTHRGVTLADVISAFETEGASDPTVKKEEEEEEDMPASQVSLSQTDETIRRLEKEGELNEVIGSQSMLSQELIMSSQRTEASEGVEGYSNFQLSQQTETSTAMAQRLGLLTQTQEEEEEEDTTEPAPNQLGLETSQAVSFADMNGSSTKAPPPAAPVAQMTSLSDTPIRQSECFGSLLDAVEQITREEEMNGKMVAWQHADAEDSSTSMRSPEASSRINGRKPSSGSKRKLPATSLSSKSKSKSKAVSPSSPKKSRKSVATRRKEQEQKKNQEIAKRAAALAEQTITDPDMAKKLLLSMALVRENPRSVPTVLPPKGAVVPEGFFWAHYPPLEAVLKKYMAEYYDLSTTKCQSAQQQSFNNDLVILVRDVARLRGWKFHQTFSDKGLRDRIRCYYKTHIQNAKKRLRTMVRNPTKRANARHLCTHLDLIKQHKSGDPNVELEDENDSDDMSEEEVTKPKAKPNVETSRNAKSPIKSPPATTDAVPSRAIARSRSGRPVRPAVVVEL